MDTHRLGFRWVENFHGVLPKFGIHFTSWIGSLPKIVACVQGRNEVYFFVTDLTLLPKMLIPEPKNDENFELWTRFCC